MLLHEYLCKFLDQGAQSVLGSIGDMFAEHQPLPKQRVDAGLDRVRLQPPAAAHALACRAEQPDRQRIAFGMSAVSMVISHRSMRAHVSPLLTHRLLSSIVRRRLEFPRSLVEPRAATATRPPRCCAFPCARKVRSPSMPTAAQANSASPRPRADNGTTSTRSESGKRWRPG